MAIMSVRTPCGTSRTGRSLTSEGKGVYLPGWTTVLAPCWRIETATEPRIEWGPLSVAAVAAEEAMDGEDDDAAADDMPGP